MSWTTIAARKWLRPPLLPPLLLALALRSIATSAHDAAAASGDAITPPPREASRSLQSLTSDRIISDVLSCVMSWQREGEDLSPNRPFVTLTYAQSLDGCIAVRDGAGSSSNLRLSGDESSRLTHALRSVHDAVLVGGDTLATDNPRLNVRLWPVGVGAGGVYPRPVALDTHLRRVREMVGGGEGSGLGKLRAKGLIVCCSRPAAESWRVDSDALTEGGITLLPCALDPSGRGLDLADVLRRLRSRHGVQSVMVEGGSGVLSSFAAAGLADCVCVTITPNVIGGRGVAAFQGLDLKDTEVGGWGDTSSAEDCKMLHLGQRASKFLAGLGPDCVLLARWPR